MEWSALLFPHHVSSAILLQGYNSILVSALAMVYIIRASACHVIFHAFQCRLFKDLSPPPPPSPPPPAPLSKALSLASSVLSEFLSALSFI